MIILKLWKTKMFEQVIYLDMICSCTAVVDAWFIPPKHSCSLVVPSHIKKHVRQVDWFEPYLLPTSWINHSLLHWSANLPPRLEPADPMKFCSLRVSQAFRDLQPVQSCLSRLFDSRSSRKQTASRPVVVSGSLAQISKLPWPAHWA